MNCPFKCKQLETTHINRSFKALFFRDVKQQIANKNKMHYQLISSSVKRYLYKQLLGLSVQKHNTLVLTAGMQQRDPRPAALTSRQTRSQLLPLKWFLFTQTICTYNTVEHLCLNILFNSNARWMNSRMTTKMLLKLSICVCVCVCARACVPVCVCACVCVHVLDQHELFAYCQMSLIELNGRWPTTFLSLAIRTNEGNWVYMPGPEIMFGNTCSLKRCTCNCTYLEHQHTWISQDFTYPSFLCT